MRTKIPAVELNVHAAHVLSSSVIVHEHEMLENVKHKRQNAQVEERYST